MSTKTGATRYISQVVGPKQTDTVLAAGTQFYLTAASGPIFVKPGGGSFALYYSAMGDTVPDGFTVLTVYNPTAFAITFQVLVGFSDVIDKRQLPSTQTPTIVKLTANVDLTPGFAEYPLLDWSGRPFNDPAGTPWLAIRRVSIYMQVLQQLNDITFTVYLTPNFSGQILFQVSDQTATSGPAPAPTVFQSAGDFYVFVNNGSGNGGSYTIFETYEAIAPNSQSYQPPN